MGKQVQAVATQRQALGEREGILDRQTHVGNTQLSLDSTIVELYGTMYDTLRMYQYLYLTGLNTKEPFGLNDLKAFVHHGG